jgi:hypothetical protein
MQPGRRHRSTAASRPSAAHRALESSGRPCRRTRMVPVLAPTQKHRHQLEHSPPAAQADLGLERQAHASASKPDSPGPRRDQPRRVRG